MKKLFISLAVVLMCVAQLNAQSKEAQKALKDLAKAKELVAKKGNKAESWLKLGDAYRNCYEAPINGLSINANELQTKILLKDQTILSSEQKEVGKAVMVVNTYADKELYFDQMGNLRAWKILKPTIEEDALQEALKAYTKASEMNISKRDLEQSVKLVSNDYWNMAMSANILNDFKGATDGFENTYRVSRLIGMVDTASLSYAAIMATLSKQYQRAVDLSTECINLGYEDGNLYAMLAENYKELGQADKAKEYLEKGFIKFPNSQEILVSLINSYLDSKESPEKILDLVHSAQANEPNNASLYYSEGNIYRELKQFDKAIELFRKASEVDPKYFYAPYAEGDTYYSMALDLQDKASNEMDNDKYNKLNDELTECLKKAINPFTKAFEITEDPELKVICAEYLRNIFFRFQSDSPEYASLYEKYNNYLKEAAQ